MVFCIQFVFECFQCIWVFDFSKHLITFEIMYLIRYWSQCVDIYCIKFRFCETLTVINSMTKTISIELLYKYRTINLRRKFFARIILTWINFYGFHVFLANWGNSGSAKFVLFYYPWKWIHWVLFYHGFSLTKELFHFLAFWITNKGTLAYSVSISSVILEKLVFFLAIIIIYINITYLATAKISSSKIIEI